MTRLFSVIVFFMILSGLLCVSPTIAQTRTSEQGVRCVYKESANRTVTIYLKNGNVRAEGFTLGLTKPGNVLLTKDALHLWNSGEKQGIIMPIVVSTKATAKQQKQSRDDLLKAITQFKKNCKQTAVSDSVFSVPTGVKFINYRQKFKELNVTVIPDLTPSNEKKPTGKTTR